jgi:hypothetical protein
LDAKVYQLWSMPPWHSFVILVRVEVQGEPRTE